MLHDQYNSATHQNIYLDYKTACWMEIPGFSEDSKELSHHNASVPSSSPKHTSNRDCDPTGLHQPAGLEHPTSDQIENAQDGSNECPNSIHCLAQESLQKRAKMNFMRKLYFLMGVQLLTATAFCYLSQLCTPVLQFQLTYWWVIFILVPLMAVGFSLLLREERLRQYPNNIIFLIVYTLCFSYLVSMVTAGNTPTLVLGTAALATFVLICLTIYTLLTHKEDNPLYGTLYGSLIVVGLNFVGVSILYILAFQSIIQQLYCASIVVMVGILTLVDIELIGGRKSINISMDDYLIGLLMLEVDIVRVCLRLFRMLIVNK